MGVHRRRLVGGRFGECKTSNGSKSKGRLSVTHAILLGLLFDYSSKDWLLLLTKSIPFLLSARILIVFEGCSINQVFIFYFSGP